MISNTSSNSVLNIYFTSSSSYCYNCCCLFRSLTIVSKRNQVNKSDRKYNFKISQSLTHFNCFHRNSYAFDTQISIIIWTVLIFMKNIYSVQLFTLIQNTEFCFFFLGEFFRVVQKIFYISKWHKIKTLDLSALKSVNCCFFFEFHLLCTHSEWTNNRNTLTAHTHNVFYFKSSGTFLTHKQVKTEWKEY